MPRLSALAALGLICGLCAAGPSARASEGGGAPGRELLFGIPGTQTQPRGATRGEWNYTFLRRNFTQRIFDTGQHEAVRSQHRKTHVVTWRAEHGLTERVQADAEVVYHAYRQHTHSPGDEHDRNDDGDFERLYAGFSYQVLEESDAQPALRMGGGVLLPSRAETEGIGQEAGLDVMAASGKDIGHWRVGGALGFSMTFGNRAHPADPVLSNLALVPISKPHDLKTLRYGVAMTRAINDRWQGNLELIGETYEYIELNQRRHASTLSLTPGLFVSLPSDRFDGWVGFGVPIGLTEQTSHLGVAIRTGARF